MSDHATPETETLARVRRIETRLTRVANHLNIDVGGAKPRWDANHKRIVVESSNCSLIDLFKSVPLHIKDTELIPIYIGEQFYFCLRMGR